MTALRCPRGSADYELLLAGRSSRLHVVDYEFKVLTCKECGLGTTIPQPDTAQYGEGYALSTAEGRFTGLRHVERLLAPGGRLFVFVPTWRGLLPRVMHDHWMGWAPSQHVWHFDRRSLTALFGRETSLSIVECTTKGVIEPPSAGARGVVKRFLAYASRITGHGDQIQAVFQRVSL